MRKFIPVLLAAALIATALPASAEASCHHNHKCWQRVHVVRANRWCSRHESCYWRHQFYSRPAGWQAWAWSTARCESGLNFHIATGNGFYGGLQFDARTASVAGFETLPHLVTKWEQMTRAIDYARNGHVGAWPVCGR